MSKGIEIAEFNKSDVGFCDVQEFVLKNDHLFPDPFSAHVDLSVYLRKLLGNAQVLVAKDKGTFCGLACAYMNDHVSRTAHLQLLLVDGGHQKKGVGRRLCREVLRSAKGHGMERVLLVVDRSNVVAERLYKSLGFLDYAEQHGNPDKKYLECMLIARNMMNFTVGPVQMDEETLRIGGEQLPYFRTPEFSQAMKESEALLCECFDAPENSRAIFLTGSGTAGMEAGVINFFTSKDRLLVVNGGTFGERFSRLCTVADIPFTEIKLDFGVPLTREMLEAFGGKDYTGVVLQLCETSSGVKHDLQMVGDFCRRNRCFLFVDAISGFLADEISMRRMNVNAVITGSQKALSLPPSMSFTILDEVAQERCYANKVKSIYFNYADYLRDGERGQTPFTPAVGALLQLHDKLRRIKGMGGVPAMNKMVHERAAYFRAGIKHLPLRMLVPAEHASNCVTALAPTKPKVGAHRIFEILKDEYDMWICPNGGTMKEKVFRVGHIGSIVEDEIDRLVDAFEDLVRRDLL